MSKRPQRAKRCPGFDAPPKPVEQIGLDHWHCDGCNADFYSGDTCFRNPEMCPVCGSHDEFDRVRVLLVSVVNSFQG